MAVDHLALLHRLVEEVYNAGNLAVAEALYAPTVLVNDQPYTVDELVAAMRQVRTTLPDLQVTVEVLGLAGDLLAVAWTIQRTAGETAGSERESQWTSGWTGLRLLRVVEGKIMEVWLNAAARQQLEDLDLSHPRNLPLG